MKVLLLITSLFVFISNPVYSRNFDDINIVATKASGQVYMLKGAGGNIGVLATKSGLLLVDDQFAPLAEKIEQAMTTISNNELKYIVNTHFHGDHTGSNTYFSHKAPIFAHQKVRERLRNKSANKQVALPVVTYETGVTIYLSAETIQLNHFPAAHTDGDTVVYFKTANVLHTGDLFFEIGFPYVDINNGGSVKGYLSAVNTLIAQMPDDVVIIPGHGKLTNKARYQEFSDMISYSINHVQTLLAQGKTEQEILALGIGKEYQHWSWYFITEEKWLKTLITDLK
ncbi:MAG: MBL fold metallo-hydrolase [Colwellia sp.]|nr:MBL fold metallo-hydrolase [Colwellia sp.]MCW9082145.1 MBL fold metallo-hydrolase [Colwellia sp.]